MSVDTVTRYPATVKLHGGQGDGRVFEVPWPLPRQLVVPVPTSAKSALAETGPTRPSSRELVYRRRLNSSTWPFPYDLAEGPKSHVP